MKATVHLVRTEVPSNGCGAENCWLKGEAPRSRLSEAEECSLPSTVAATVASSAAAAAVATCSKPGQARL